MQSAHFFIFIKKQFSVAASRNQPRLNVHKFVQQRIIAGIASPHVDTQNISVGKRANRKDWINVMKWMVLVFFSVFCCQSVAAYLFFWYFFFKTGVAFFKFIPFCLSKIWFFAKNENYLYLFTLMLYFNIY